jgi:hypothetical protein
MGLRRGIERAGGAKRNRVVGIEGQSGSRPMSVTAFSMLRANLPEIAFVNAVRLRGFSNAAWSAAS